VKLNDRDQGRMLPGAPEAFVVSAHYVVNEGWTMRISVRRQFQSWAGCSEGAYSYLTTGEAFDVMCAAIGSELGL